MRYLLLLTLLLASLAASPATAPSDADYTTHLSTLKARLAKDAPGAGFTLLIQKPFVVIGDDTPARVKTSSERTVQWAVERLRKDFFDKDPEEILDVYLFKDKASYDKYTRELFHTTPTTPYGYFSPTDKALIMNIGTGGGTLVHEIVHPYVAVNFPACPPWFNEGLGSLFEQSAEKEGHIVGLTNWRLAGLQEAIRDKKTIPFKDLFALGHADFYTKDRGTNYGQSRYLLYYLQEKGVLRDYYKAFVKNQKTDPTGLATLQDLLKEPDFPAFQTRWEAWVLTLRFP